MAERFGPASKRTVLGVVGRLLFASAVLLPYGLLVLQSCGSGWTFPALVPERLDFAPWRRFLSDRDGLMSAVLTSLGISFAVSAVGTAGGLMIGRAVRASNSTAGRFLIYWPFVVSPVIVGVAVYDLFVRLHGSGTVVGVILAQSLFATAFAAVYFSELWSSRAERLEALVRTLGGSEWEVWRHAVLPQSSGLIALCLLQTALFSWLDYGLVFLIGGGRVSSVTMKLFASLREANVNQAAQAGLILLVPAVLGVAIAGLIFSHPPRRRAESRSNES